MDAHQPRGAAESHCNPPSQAAPEGTTRRGLLDKLTARLTGLYDAREARSIALIALAELAGLPLSALQTDPGAPMAADGFEAMAAQLAAGRPVQYVVGHTEFYGHRFTVREGVLIPRPETEELVAAAAARAVAGAAALDVGTGSGCIAVSLARLIPDARVTAVDLSPQALAVARRNAVRLGAEVRFVQADALAGLHELPDAAFDLIVSNPPYLTAQEMRELQPEVAKEPAMALEAGDDGLVFYRAIAEHYQKALRPGGADGRLHRLFDGGIQQREALALIFQHADLRGQRGGIVQRKRGIGEAGTAGDVGGDVDAGAAQRPQHDGSARHQRGGDPAREVPAAPGVLKAVVFGIGGVVRLSLIHI